MPDTLRTDYRLEDRYTLEGGRVYLTGIQALVRLLLEQRRRDRAAGHATAGYCTGYRGSPLGGLDQQMWAAAEQLAAHDVRFQPAVNEDLAATALWGTQQAQLDGEGTCEGVFGMWYGKGPGVDRSGDALRHANLAGTAPLGGVLALLGDDHTCESSTTCHQSEPAMIDAMIPVLNPAGVQEILDYGLYGWALSRFSGCWVALKCVHDTVEAAATVEVGPERAPVVLPADYRAPPGGLNIRWPDTPQEQERRLHEDKHEAVRAFARANRLDRVVLGGEGARLAVVTTGKSYLDVRQALDDLGIDEVRAAELGLRLYKVAMPYPLEPEGALAACAGVERVLVVEEKRGIIEPQLKELLYGRARAPAVAGKRDEAGRALLPSAGRLDSNAIAAAIGRRLLAVAGDDEALRRRVERIEQLAARVPEPPAMLRLPYFCAGCPHNTSTRVPEGSRARAGIGCHYMAQWMDRATARFTHMGGEGASWIGEAPFSRRGHVFQNIGDGTYYHSGLLAIRAAVAAGVNITFKILYNDAVAMTGGQPMDGPLTVGMITRQVDAEGVRRVVVVSDQPGKYRDARDLAPGTRVHGRERLDAVQRELREVEGVTVLVYEQTCAAEKRRRRKRGRYPDPPRRVFINELVCEGCGDCGQVSNCVAIVPLETPFGRRRAIDQSACNKDFSCLEGLCPSFVTVHGAEPRRRTAGPEALAVEGLPEPALPALERPWGIVVTGVGGTGVLTVGALLGMAAHLEGKGCSVLDMTGLAQKGGAVTTHLRIAARQDQITATRIAAGGADLLLGCDLVVSAGPEALRTVASGRTRVVVNEHRQMTGEFALDGDLRFPAAELRAALERGAGRERVEPLAATRLAVALLGDAIAANLLLLGYAWQRGAVPLSAAAIERAIELNGVAVEMNVAAFRWGRRLAVEPEAVAAAAGLEGRPPESGEPAGLEALVAQRADSLVAYQGEALARRYRALVERAARAERERACGLEGLAETVARAYYRLLACKDEYEVARLYTDGRFERRLAETFGAVPRLELHLAPPLIARRDPLTGRPRKRAYGPWVLGALRLLARLRWLRGTPLDPFGYSAERRLERRLRRDYEALVEELCAGLDPASHALAVELAAVPLAVRGFGPVKARAAEAAEARQAELLARWRAGGTGRPAAA